MAPWSHSFVLRLQRFRFKKTIKTFLCVFHCEVTVLALKPPKTKHGLEVGEGDGNRVCLTCESLTLILNVFLFHFYEYLCLVKSTYCN